MFALHKLCTTYANRPQGNRNVVELMCRCQAQAITTKTKTQGFKHHNKLKAEIGQPANIPFALWKSTANILKIVGWTIFHLHIPNITNVTLIEG
ncbi:unnamed protein product [Trichogramma brassicae]|uniref:Uncharacterized protein n=1 Tax=Trichogramma brassicae TaxID=86971 RepID=A0A6H5IYE6_9HYME|nr:unnamed protein product [Trichogramma brassicae]